VDKKDLMKKCTIEQKLTNCI